MSSALLRPATPVKSPAVRVPKTFFLVVTWAGDLPILEANRKQLAALADAGHTVALLCDPGDRVESWLDLALPLVTPRHYPYELLPRKCAHGFAQALGHEWEWLVKIDSDTLISGDLPKFLSGFPTDDAVGVASEFEPVLDAIRTAGPPDVSPDVLSGLGNRYLRGFCYAVRRGSLERALPVFERLARRFRIAEDAVLTASLAATGARVSFTPRLTCDRSWLDTAVDLESPVINVESRDPTEREFFTRRAQALFELSQQDALGSNARVEEKHAERSDHAYDKSYYKELETVSSASAAPIAESIRADLAPRRVLDVGCGAGALLRALEERGVDCHGVDSSEAALELCKAAGLNASRLDLLRDDLPWVKAVDVVTSLEVAEHLPESCAARYVGYLCAHSDVVVFSAARPGQGGHDHINEQPLEYWIAKFRARGFDQDQALTDRWRREWAAGGRVGSWYWQNLMVFRRKQVAW